ncbi:MAG: hypothetical protein ACR2NN_27510 [Bryobacteraceae bacterium]
MSAMRAAARACLLVWFSILANAADQQEKFYAPTLSCWVPDKQPPPKDVQRTPILVSPNERYRAYTQIDSHFDPALPQPCRTKAQLFISSRESSFKLAFVEETSEKYAPAVSLGPVAWSPNSRWLALERASGYYASDAGGLDFVLYDSTTRKVSTPNVLGTIEKSIRKHCNLGYRSFKGFDARNRLVLRVADWQDDNGRETYCVAGTAEWLFDPVTGKVQPSARSNPE